MIRCPHCNSSRLRVAGHAHRLKSDLDPTYLRRHRQCKSCKRHFHTREYAEGDLVFDREAIRIALGHLAKAAIALRKQTHTKPRKDTLKSDSD